MGATATVTLKEFNDKTHRFEQVVEVNLQNPHYVAIECLSGSQFIFNHLNVKEIEIIQNKEG